MAEKKITKRDRFEFAKSVVLAHPELFAEIPDMAEFIDHEIELLNRKTSKSASLTPAQKDSIALTEFVKDALAGCENEQGMTVGELMKVPTIAQYVCFDKKAPSSQKLTALLTKLAPKEGDGDLVREVVKKVAYFRLNYGVAEG